MKESVLKKARKTIFKKTNTLKREAETFVATFP